MLLMKVKYAYCVSSLCNDDPEGCPVDYRISLCSHDGVSKVEMVNNHLGVGESPHRPSRLLSADSKAYLSSEFERCPFAAPLLIITRAKTKYLDDGFLISQWPTEAQCSNFISKKKMGVNVSMLDFVEHIRGYICILVYKGYCIA